MSSDRVATSAQNPSCFNRGRSQVCVVASIRPWEGKWQIQRDGKVYERDTEAEVLYKGYLLAGYNPSYEQSWLLEIGDRLLQRLQNSVPMDTGTLELWVPEGEVYTRLALGWLAAQERIQAQSVSGQGDVRWGKSGHSV
ncbi:MAG: hypothetical protein ACAF41_33420 (plasmid) [Leptolyngbya sp. BL-A-14]